MRKINFEEPSNEAWQNWKNKCLVETETLISLRENGQKCEINAALYKEPKNTIFDSFNGKCGYCEKKLELSYESEIDHYRPKNKVTDQEDKPVLIHGPSGTVEHPGYYWLAYDYKNFVLSCQLCNKPNNEGEIKIGKRNRFPVEDNYYASTIGDEVHEKPLIINPTSENPEDYLVYNPENGFIEAKDNNPRGETCIKIFGLNIRDDLIEGRKEAYDKVITEFIDYLGSCKSHVTQHEKKKKHERFCKKMKEIQEGKTPYSLAAHKAFNEQQNLLRPLLNE